MDTPRRDGKHTLVTEEELLDGALTAGMRPKGRVPLELRSVKGRDAALTE